ncbi:MAG: HEAT repeat domain-containing protein [Planctomycetota bacterium]
MRVLAAWFVFSLAVIRGAAGQTPNDLDAQRQILAQPGPEARIEREAAIENLLSRHDPAAHEVLRDIVRRGPDADEVALTVLAQLRRKLANPHDPVFGNGERERGLGRGYLPALATLFARRESADDALRALREEARSCVAALSAADRRRAFEQMLSTADPEQRRGAILLAGSSRDLGLAPMLAAGLDVPDTAADAREALASLTFVDAFASKQQFEQWWEANHDGSYLLLAEQAAQRARVARGNALRRAEARTTEVLVELVEALAQRDAIAWSRIGERILADDPPGSARPCLERLRDVLAKTPRHGGVAADRLALLQKLQLHLAEGAPPPELRAVLIETCAYLVAPAEDRPAEEVLALLRDALQHERAVVRRAAVLGLGRFPAPEVTRLLVGAGAQARTAGEASVLTAALGSLAAAGRAAPSGDAETFAAWLDLVDGVLRDESVPETTREAALAVLEQKDPQGKLVPKCFQVLTAVASNRAQAPLVREKATVLMMPHAAADRDAANAYIDTLIKLLVDPEKRMRLKGAQLLQTLPRNRDLPDGWRMKVIGAVGELLAKETDEVVLRALVTCLERQVDPEKPDLEPVISRLCLALEEMGRSNVSGVRRQVMVSALAGQAATQGLDVMQWVRAAETLLALGERRELRNVVERQNPLQLVSRDGVSEKSLRLALETTVSTALLKPKDEAWSPRECADVIGALQYLDSIGASVPSPDRTLLRLEVLTAAGQWDTALQRAKKELDAGKLDPANRERVRVLVLRAYLGKQDLDQAVRLLGSEGVGGGDPGLQAQLREEVGVALLRGGRSKEALAMLVEAQKATPESDESYPRRLLRRLDAEARAEPEAQAAVLQRLLERETLFTGTEVSAELRAEFDSVKDRLSRKL